MIKAFAILAGLFIAYVAFWTYQDRQAEAAANQFCNGVMIGSAVAGAVAQAKTAGGRYISGSDSNPQMFFFQGPIFNGYFCNLTVAGGKVVSRQVTRKED